MIRSTVVLCVVLAVISSFAGGQTTPPVTTEGVPPFSLQSNAGGGIDSINLGTLGMHLAIPINSNGVYGPKSSAALWMESGFPLVLSGGKIMIGVGGGNLFWLHAPVSGPAFFYEGGVNGCTGDFAGLVDATGAYHSTPKVSTSSCNTFYASAPGKDGWQAVAWTGNPLGGIPAQFLAVAPDGTGSSLNPFALGQATVSSYNTDLHGNSTTYTNYLATGGQWWADAANNLTATTVNYGHPPTEVDYPGPGGTTQHYSMTWNTYTVNSDANCGAYHQSYMTPGSYYFLTSLGLPDGSSYEFTYEYYWGSTTTYTGRIGSVKLPTGALITYTYSGGTNNQGVWCDDGSGATITKTTPDGSWSFVHCEYGLSQAPKTCNTTPPTGWTKNHLATTTVTEPSGDYAIYSTTSYTPTDPSQKVVLPIQKQSFGVNGPGCSVASPCNLWSQGICYIGDLSYPTCITAPTQAGGWSPITEKDVYTFVPGIANPSLTVYQADSSERPTITTVYGFGGTRTSGNWDTQTQIVYGTWNGNACVPVTIPVATGVTYQVMDRVCSRQVFVGGNSTTPVSKSYNTYNSTADLVTQQDTIGGVLVTTATNYYDSHGRLTKSVGPNGETTQTTYNACSGQEPDSTTITTSSSTSLITKYTSYDCSGERLLTKQDANGNNWSTSYTGDPFWRPMSTTDALNNVTSYHYTPTTKQTTLTVASGSVEETLTQFDSMGRPQLSQVLLNGTGNYNITETDYDVNGRVSRVTLPYTAAARTLNSTIDGFKYTYDGLDRLLTEIGPAYSSTIPGTTKTYTYTANDTQVIVSPAPSGENTKSTQTEVNGLGEVTSVCEITSMTGSASCGQTNSANGFLTTYTYYPGGKLQKITQNAKGTTTQARSFTYDNGNTGRMLTANTPESGTVTTTYDSDPSSYCPAFTGFPVKTVDNAGGTSCMSYDLADRVTTVSYPTGLNSGNSPTKTFTYDKTSNSNVSCSVTNQAGKLAEATKTSPLVSAAEGLLSVQVSSNLLTALVEFPRFGTGTYITFEGLTNAAFLNGQTVLVSGMSSAGNNNFWVTASFTHSDYPSTADSGSVDTGGLSSDEAFCYDQNGRPSDIFSWAPGGFSHIAENYFPDGQAMSLSVPTQPAITYALDPNGRLNTVTAASGLSPILTSTTYYDDGLPNIVKLGTGDTSTYTPWANLQPNIASHTIGTSSSNTITHTLTWNPNGTLVSLATVDQPYPANSQTCNFAYDDLERVTSDNCGSHWNESSTYDVFGNVTKSGSAPWPVSGSYNQANNQYSSSAFSYDANGRLTNDTFDTLGWDVNGNLITQSGTTLVYDAFDRPVMAGSTQYLYAPDGSLVATENNSGTILKMFVPLPMARAVYVSGTLDHYDRYDWQGSARVASTASRTVYSDTSYDAFGIPYWSAGTINNQYAGLNSDISSGTEQVSSTRRYHPTQGRWISPDKVIPDIHNPQTFNAYHYSLNQPTNANDPGGNCDGTDPTGCSGNISIFGSDGGLSGLAFTATLNLPAGCACDNSLEDDWGYWVGQTFTPVFKWDPVVLPVLETSFIPNTPYQDPIVMPNPDVPPRAGVNSTITIYPSQQPELAARIQRDRVIDAMTFQLGTAWFGGLIGALVPPIEDPLPPNSGFLGSSRVTTLQKGTYFDRYGSEFGKFASPVDTPFGARSLPSQGALTRPYYIYRVTQPIEVQEGVVAPWFGQPGLGTQYELPGSIGDLLNSGAIERVPQ